MRADLPRFLSVSGRILPGVKRPVQVANPPAGADWQATVPTGRQWRVLALRAQFHSSIVVANRHARLVFTVDGVQVCEVITGATWTANATWGFTGAVGGAVAHDSSEPVSESMPLPDMIMGGGASIASLTAAIDVGDQWSQVALYVEECYLDDQMLSLQELELAAELEATRRRRQPATTGA